MAEFKTVSGQLEGMWNGAMGEAEAAGRKAGEAAATEKVLQAVAKLETEWPGRQGHPVPGFEQELRRRLSLPEPEVVDDGLERLTFAEWEARARLAGWVHALDKGPELPPSADLVPEPLARFGESDEERRVLVDRRGGEALQPKIAQDLAAERARQLAAEDAAQVFPEEDAVLLDGTRASDEPKEATGPAFRPSTLSA